MVRESADVLTRRAIKHLRRRHREEMRTDFSAEDIGLECANRDCGYEFSDEISGFECPECGRDNISQYAVSLI
jgi:predicted Zn-ribbon and HTH transcriptional regulator